MFVRPAKFGAVSPRTSGKRTSPRPRPERFRHRQQQGRPARCGPHGSPAVAARRAATPFASACSAFRCLRTSSGASRLSPVSTRPFLLPALFPNQGPFAPAALPAFPATTGPSATLPAPAGPRGFQVGACAPPTGLPVLRLPSSSGVSEPVPELVGSRQSPPVLSSFRRSSRTRAPSLPPRYRRSPLLRAHPPPCRPRLALAGSRWARARHRQGFPCCGFLPLPCVLAPIPRRKRVGARVAHFPTRRRPSPIPWRVGFRSVLFEACSAFTRVLARRVAEPP